MHELTEYRRLSYNPPVKTAAYGSDAYVQKMPQVYAANSQGVVQICIARNRLFNQSDLDRRNLSYDEALNLGNILQDRADMLPGDDIVYAVSDRDSYRRTLELYLKDGVLTQAEQLLLWEERRRLGIDHDVHNRLLEQLLAVWTRQGKSVQIHAFRRGVVDD